MFLHQSIYHGRARLYIAINVNKTSFKMHGTHCVVVYSLSIVERKSYINACSFTLIFAGFAPNVIVFLHHQGDCRGILDKGVGFHKPLTCFWSEDLICFDLSKDLLEDIT